MKKILLSIYIVISSLFLVTCKKELSCEGCASNKAPVANAGIDQISVLPKDSVLLDGSASHDVDGTIVKYQWSKIDGPSSAQVVHPDSVKTMVRVLAEGVYHFQLEVIDDKTAHAKDTVQITVNKSTAINQPPIARAGRDTTITLPANVAILDGRSSYDSDGVITRYQWSKISGPITVSFDSIGTARTRVTDLVEGVYQFELMVTDNGGLSAKDTVQVTVNIATITACNNSGWPVATIAATQVGSLSEARLPNAGAALNIVVFAGGWKPGYSCCFLCGEFSVGSSVADILNVSTGSWQQHQLSKARLMGAVASVGNKIVFAGGSSWSQHSGAEYDDSYDNVDIYDASSNFWEVAHLSKNREDMATAVVGNKVLFAGGTFFTGNPMSNQVWDVTNAVDIYDASTDQWSAHTLSVARSGISTVVLNNNVYFIGGWGYGSVADYTKVVDVYNNAIGSWSVSDLQTIVSLLSPPVGMGEVSKITQAADNIIFWGANNQVGIRNLTSGKTSTACLSPNNASFYVNNKIVFYGETSNQFAIYDPVTTSWSKGEANIPAGFQYGIVVLNNSLYLAGGINSSSINGTQCIFSDKVYRLTW